MAGSVNKVILVGNLGRDPDVRSFQNGGKVAELRIATSETWKDRNSGGRRVAWFPVLDAAANPLCRLGPAESVAAGAFGGEQRVVCAAIEVLPLGLVDDRAAFAAQ